MIRYLSSFPGTPRENCCGSGDLSLGQPKSDHQARLQVPVQSSRSVEAYALDLSRIASLFFLTQYFTTSQSQVWNMTVSTLKIILQLAVMQVLLTLRYRYKPQMNVHNSTPHSFR